MESSGVDRKPGAGLGLVQRSPAGAADVAPGKRTLTSQLGAGAPPPHAAPARQVAERDPLNAVITVIARGPDGAVLARWRARGRWDGPLPVRYHGNHAPLPAGWTWSDPRAQYTKIHTRADGSGGESVERWATEHRAATVDVIASDLNDAAQNDDAADPAAKVDEGPAAVGQDVVPGANTIGTDVDQLISRALGPIEPDLEIDDDVIAQGHGAPGGDPHGRLGADTTLGGTGPGGPQARPAGDREGSETRGAIEGSHLGSALGVEDGSEGGRFGGEGKPGDNGVRGAGAIAGGVIAIPAALKGVVELMLLADAGDITGAGASAFTKLGKELAGMGAAAVRQVLAREARIACEKELRATIERLSANPRWLALSAEEQARAIRIAAFELQRRFFRGFAKAAKEAEVAATQTLRGAAGARKVAAQESLDTARVGAEAAEVEPVAGRLPRNHRYAGGEFPREQLPAKYRAEGLKIKRNGYPDFEPYALELPTGKKTVRIELTGSRRADEALANKAAGLAKPPKGYTWHHLEEEGTMMLVPTPLHQVVGHTAGAAKFVDRTGVAAYGP